MEKFNLKSHLEKLAIDVFAMAMEGRQWGRDAYRFYTFEEILEEERRIKAGEPPVAKAWRDLVGGGVDENGEKIPPCQDYRKALPKIAGDIASRSARLIERYGADSEEVKRIQNPKIGVSPVWGIYYVPVGPYMADPKDWRNLVGLMNNELYDKDGNNVIDGNISKFITVDGSVDGESKYKSLREFIKVILDDEIKQRESDPEFKTKSARDKYISEHKGTWSNLSRQLVNGVELWRLANFIDMDRSNLFGFFPHRFQLAKKDSVLAAMTRVLFGNLAEYSTIFDPETGERVLDPSCLEFELKQNVKKKGKEKAGEVEDVLSADLGFGSDSGTIKVESLDQNSESFKNFFGTDDKPGEGRFMDTGSNIGLNLNGYMKLFDILKENKKSSLKLEILKLIQNNIDVDFLVNGKINSEKLIKYIKSVNNDVLSENAPTVVRIKESGIGLDASITSMVDRLNKTFNPTYIPNIIAHEEKSINNVSGRDKMTDLLNQAFTILARENGGLSIDDLKKKALDYNDPTGGMTIIKKIFQLIRSGQDKIAKDANDPNLSDEERLNAQNLLDSMVAIPDFSELKSLRGTVGQQRTESFRVYPSDIEYISNKIVIVKLISEKIGKYASIDDEAFLKDIADSLNKIFKSSTKSKTTIGNWNSVNVRQWIGLILKEEGVSAENAPWQNMIENSEKIKSNLSTALLSDTPVGSKSINDAVRLFNIRYNGGQVDEKTGRINVAPDKGLVSLADDNHNYNTEQLTDKRNATGRVAESACTTLSKLNQDQADVAAGLTPDEPYSFNLKAKDVTVSKVVGRGFAGVSLSLPQRLNIAFLEDLRKAVDAKGNPKYSFEDIVARYRKKPSSAKLEEEKWSTFDLWRDEMFPGKTYSRPIKFPTDLVRFKDWLDELKNNGLAYDEIVKQYWGIKALEKSRGKRQEALDLWTKENYPERANFAINQVNDNGAIVPIENNPAEHANDFNVNVQDAPVQNAPAQEIVREAPGDQDNQNNFHNLKNPPMFDVEVDEDDEDNRRAFPVASNKNERHLIASTLKNLMSIAKDLDEAGKSGEAEEIHNTIRKYINNLNKV